MLIRSEAPADILPIDALLKRAFPTDAEANLVMALRENGRRTLSLVACTDDGEVIGHLFMSPVTVAGEDLNWQGLAPLAVDPQYQKQGIGLALIEEAKSVLADFYYPVMVVLGDPNYYGKAGFTPANAHQLHCQWEVPADAFQVYAIDDDALNNHTGLVEYSVEFSELA
ncbi:N-acetyltransferase [Photobacterium damselae subsp. damselae]|uniref:GNAT family N-acetyltransferase n=1 Tax=Photobacterium damselae TaxID=38293 RepID=UPI001F342EEC|nr:N-acetyltransferase [Photobacterium damselae]UKA24936.1 N-acetyltransferase [Photobacterium damselae subsp. damselae]